MESPKNDIEGDQRMTGANAYRAGGRMQLVAERRSGAPRADVGKGVLLAMTVVIDRDPQLVPDPIAQREGELVGVGEGGAVERHYWNDVGRSNAGVNSAMRPQVDMLYGHLDRSDQRIQKLGSLTNNGNDDSVVVSVRVDVDDVGATRSSGELGNNVCSSPFREIGHRFEQVIRLHAPVSLRAHARPGRSRVWRRVDEAPALGPAPAAAHSRQAGCGADQLNRPDRACPPAAATKGDNRGARARPLACLCGSRAQVERSRAAAARADGPHRRSRLWIGRQSHLRRAARGNLVGSRRDDGG